VKNEVLMALALRLAEDAVHEHVSRIEPIRGPRGFRGRDGQDGNDFHLKDHKQEIQNFVEEVFPKYPALSPEDKAELKGERGPKGVPGASGVDGRDFNLEENLSLVKSEILNLINKKKEELKLKFSDLDDEEVALLKGDKGARGQRGKPGESFSFEDHSQDIKCIISDVINSLREDLRLKFENLNEEEKVELKGDRGDKGRPGKDGRDFDFKESRNKIEKLVLDNKESLRLKFENLNEEEREDLKLKFEDLSSRDLENIRGARGPRGQKGKTGEPGEKGQIGPRGIPGMPGLQGIMGPQGFEGLQGEDGRDGEDGEDAPQISEIIVRKDINHERYYFVFVMSDGERIRSNTFSMPEAQASGGGSIVSRSLIQLFQDGALVASSNKVNFTGDGVTVTEGVEGQVDVDIAAGGGSTLLVNTVDTSELEFTGDGVVITDDGLGTTTVDIPASQADIQICDEGELIASSVQKIDFVGDNITAFPVVPMSEWDALSDVEPSLSEYDKNNTASQIEVRVDVPDASLLKDVDCEASVYVGSFVYVDSGSLARNALADTYNTSNVVGLVEAKSSSTKCDIRFNGLSGPIYSGLNPAEDYYLSDTTPGEISSTVSTTSGHIKIRVGQSFGQDKFLFVKGERVVRL